MVRFMRVWRSSGGSSFFSLAAVRNILVFKMTTVGYIKLFTNNRIYSVCMADMLKIQYAKHVSVVCKSKRRHIKLFSFCNKRIKLSTAVQKRVVGMYMEVNKVRYRCPLRRRIKNVNVCHRSSMLEN